MIYYGFWFSPEREAVQGLIDHVQQDVTGTVRLKLYKGTVTVTGRRSPRSLYRTDFVTFEADRVYRQQDAEGFINLNALRLQDPRAPRPRRGREPAARGMHVHVALSPAEFAGARASPAGRPLVVDVLRATTTRRGRLRGRVPADRARRRDRAAAVRAAAPCRRRRPPRRRAGRGADRRLRPRQLAARVHGGPGVAAARSCSPRPTAPRAMLRRAAAGRSGDGRRPHQPRGGGAVGGGPGPRRDRAVRGRERRASPSRTRCAPGSWSRPLAAGGDAPSSPTAPWPRGASASTTRRASTRLRRGLPVGEARWSRRAARPTSTACLRWPRSPVPGCGRAPSRPAAPRRDGRAGPAGGRTRRGRRVNLPIALTLFRIVLVPLDDGVPDLVGPRQRAHRRRDLRGRVAHRLARRPDRPAAEPGDQARDAARPGGRQAAGGGRPGLARARRHAARRGWRW